MSIFSMVMEAMEPVYDTTFCDIVALESDTDCFADFRAACGTPKYEAPEDRVRMMSATEALNRLAEHGRLAAAMDAPVPEKPDYSAAFEAMNAGLDTTINPEMAEAWMTAKRNEAIGFYNALESFLQGDDAALEGKLWDSFMDKGAGDAGKAAVYDVNYQPRGRRNLSDFQLYTVTNDDEMNALHQKFPHIAVKRGPIIKGIRRLIDKVGNDRNDISVSLYWVDLVNPEDPKTAVCVAEASLNPNYHIIYDISVRSEFQRYGLMTQILQYVMKEYQCNEAITDKDSGDSSKRNLIAESALSKAGFTVVGEDEYDKFWRKGAPMNNSFLMSDKKHPV